MSRYERPKPGQWIKPVKRGFKMGCCDCGLVHRVDFEHVKFGKGRKIIFRVYRDNRATAATRRGAEFRK